MAGPIDPRLLRRASATRGYLVAGVAVGSATAILTLGQAWLLSRSVADIFATRQLDGLAITVAGLGVIFGAKALLGWLHQWLAHRTAAAVKSQLRRDIIGARLKHPVDSPTTTGGLITLITQGLDALDGYFSKYLPQLVLAVTVPLIVGTAILTSDLLSAVIVALTVPLIPFFMALVGWTTEALTKKRWAIQTRLAHHFADLVTGLPTLQVFGRARAQAKGLKRTEAAHVRETLRTLRVSFLSAMVLELLATLSVAVIAVTIGFRVVYGQLDLATALFVLILAPEAYLPLRQVGVHYHDSADGAAAAEAAFGLIDAHSAPTHSPAATDAPSADGEAPPAPESPPLLSLRRLSHTYPGAEVPALAETSLELAPGEVLALAGSSGSGKTTLLNAVLGFLTPTAGELLVDGKPVTDQLAWRRQLAYVGQFPGLITGTVADNVRLGNRDASDSEIRQALADAGAGQLGLEQLVGDDAEGVSAGERRRIATARALLRLRLGKARLLVLDEPTAGLDADAEAVLLESLRNSGVAALVVSHRPAVLAVADRVLKIEASEAPGLAEATSETDAEAADLPRVEAPASQASPAAGTGESADLDIAATVGGISGKLIHRLFEAVPSSRARLAAAVLLAFGATGASVALMATSAWLLSRAAEHPPVLYLLAASVMVRAFGISRGVLRYLERLVGHSIAMRMQSALRLQTYSRLARTTLLGSRRGDLLARVVADVEAIQDLVVRVWIPFTSSTLVIVGTAIAISLFSPGSAAVLLVSCLAAGLLLPELARLTSARADSAAAPLRGQLADSVHLIAGNAPDLVAYEVAEDFTEKLLAIDDELRRNEARATWTRGMASAAQVLTAGLATVGALIIGGFQVAEGTLAPVMLATLVLTPLALHEALASLIQAAQTRTRARAALQRVQQILDAPPIGSGDLPAPAEPVADPHLIVRGLSAGWPDNPPVVTGLDLELGAGARVALVGPSGIGKTTIAATVLGLIPPVAGEISTRGRIGYLPQEAHIFTTSVAENVKIGNRLATDQQLATALDRSGLNLPLDRMVGEIGAKLSGGEARRVALARLLVGDYQVLLLDEPTEHLDTDTAVALLDDIWRSTTAAALLVITHDPAVIARCDQVVELG